jgi:T5SS/PEP-CTERM-associated repeat protein
VQNGGDAVITGGFFASNGASYQVSGAGSTLSAGFINFSNGSSLTVVGGASATVSGSTFSLATAGGTGTAVIDGSGSSLTVPSTVLLGGTAVGSSSLTFRNGATGTLGPVQLGSGPNTSTNVWNIESDADVTTGNITIGAGSNTTNTVTISGNGSTITQTGASTLTVGLASGNTAALNVIGVDIAGSGATFNSGTGAITVNPTGVISVQFGTFNANGNMTINGGQLNLNTGGGIIVAAGKTLTIQSGGDATATDDFALFTAATTNVTGPGSTLSATDSVQINNGATINVSAGGILNAGNELEVGAFQTGTLVVDGVGSSATAGMAQWRIGEVTFQNGATGTFGTTALSNNNGTANLRILSGADVTVGAFLVSDGSGSPSGTITLDGAGSTLTQSGTFLLGFVGPGSLIVQNGGVFTKQSGGTLVSDDGALQINGGSATFNGTITLFGAVAALNGSLTVNGLFDRPQGLGTVSAGAGGTIRFNGEVQGDGDFIGDAGLIEFAGGYRQDPGAGTTNVATSAKFLATNTLTLQIGGLAPGTQHDELKFTGFGFPHVTFGGTLVIDLINGFNPQIGQQFDLFDFNPARVAGSFSSIQLAAGDALAPGLSFSASQLHTSGMLVVVPEPGALISLLGGAAILLGLQRFQRR